MRDVLSILLILVLIAGTGTAGMMMAGDDWGMMNGTSMGMMNGGTGSDGCPMMDSDEIHDWHEECEQIMEEECEGFDSEDCQEMYEECEEHMQHDHRDEESSGDSEDQRDLEGDEEPEKRGNGCPMMGGR